VDTEDRLEKLDKEGYHSLRKMLQVPVRDTVWSRSCFVVYLHSPFLANDMLFHHS